MLTPFAAAAAALAICSAPPPPAATSEIVAGAHAQEAATAPEPGGIGADALAAAQAYSDSKRGAALLIWRKGKIVYEHYAPGCAADTRFDTYSMAKSVLGLAYGAALRDGVIASIDEPVSDYLTEWRGDPRGAITLRQLLGMRSGLKLYSMARNEPQAMDLLTGPDVVATALGTPLESPPGHLFEYDNANSQLAGIALNRALKRAGQGDYARYLSKVLWKPLGQSDAVVALDHPGGEAHYFATLRASVRDWMRIGVMIAHDGRFDGRQVLPAAWIREATTADPVNPNYGLQIWIGSPFAPHRRYGPNTPRTAIASQPYLAPDMIFFDGSGGQRVYVSKSLDLVIVRTGGEDWTYDEAVIPNLIIAASKAP
jgi:CubicO group peptidase (beta-lactamase class C family)